MSETRTFTVSGMSCSHCVASVTEEVAEVDGVETVGVSLESGLLTVTGEPIDEARIRAAVEEAGYRVA